MYTVWVKWAGFDWKVKRRLQGSAEFLLITDWGFVQKASIYEIQNISVEWTKP